MKLKHLLLCFWILWSATEVWQTSQGTQFQGGLMLGSHGDPFISINRSTKSGRHWRKSGGYYDTKSDCEQVAASPEYKNHNLVCLPNGVKPKP